MSTNDTTATPVTFEKGSWQEALHRSTLMLDKSSKARKLASSLLWKGATEGITDWLATTADSDTSGENLYGSLLEALGVSRKGDASKIKTVAVAVRDKGLDLDQFENLAKAYGSAVALTKTAKVEADEDDAAEEAIASIDAPKTATTQDSAAALLLSKGVDGAVVAILDALNTTDGEQNSAAHRAFLRAVSGEINSREQAVKDTEAAAKKAEADAKKAEADKVREEKKAEVEAARAAKAAEKKAAAKAKGTSTTAKKATAPKATTTKAKPTTKATPVKAETPAETGLKTAKKAIPVRRK